MIAIKKLYYPVYFAFTLILGIAIGFKIYEWRHFGQSEPIMLITAVTIMILSILKDRFFDTTAIRTLEDVKKHSKENWDTLTDWIKTHLSPAIISLPTRNDVLKEASNIINAAIKEASNSNKYIVYVGSGELLKDPPETEEGDTPLTEYQSVIARVKNDGVNVTRYISLLDKQDYQKRVNQTQEAYKRWLMKQISLLEANPNYTFYDCPRAPKWGSSRSSIFTRLALLDVIGNGHSGILVRGDQVAQELLKGSRELFETAGVKPSVYKSSRLRAYLNSLEDKAPNETSQKMLLNIEV